MLLKTFSFFFCYSGLSGFFFKKSSIPISEKRNSVEVRKRKPSFRSIVCFLVWASSAVSSRVPLQKGIRLLVARSPFLNSGWESRPSVFVLIQPVSRFTFESRVRATNSEAIRREGVWSRGFAARFGARVLQREPGCRLVLILFVDVFSFTSFEL